MINKLLIIILFFVFSLNSNLNTISSDMVKYFNAWCPDAWCAGDFKHIAEDFTLDEQNKFWVLQLTSYPKFINYNSINMFIIPAIRSSCYFSFNNSLELFKIDDFHMKGISDKMSNTLIECINNVEDYFIANKIFSPK